MPLLTDTLSQYSHMSLANIYVSMYRATGGKIQQNMPFIAAIERVFVVKSKFI
jgi:hypothetical protein